MPSTKVVTDNFAHVSLPKREGPEVASIEAELEKLLRARKCIRLKNLDEFLRNGARVISANEIVESFVKQLGPRLIELPIRDKATFLEYENQFSDSISKCTRNWCLEKALLEAVDVLHGKEPEPILTSSFPTYCFGTQKTPRIFRSFGALVTAAAAEEQAIRYAYKMFYRRFDGTNSSTKDLFERSLMPAEYLKRAFETWDTGIPESSLSILKILSGCSYHLTVLNEGAREDSRSESWLTKATIEVFDQFGKIPSSKGERSELSDAIFGAADGSAATAGLSSRVFRHLGNIRRSLYVAARETRSDSAYTQMDYVATRPMVLGALGRYEEFWCDSSEKGREKYELRKAAFFRANGFAVIERPKEELELAWEFFEKGQKAQCAFLAAREVIRRRAKNRLENVYTCSFPGQEFRSPSGETRFSSWAELLRFAADLRAQAQQLDRVESPGSYLRYMIEHASPRVYGALAERAEVERADYHLASLHRKVPGPVPKSERRAFISSIIDEILSQQLGGDPEKLGTKYFLETNYSAPGDFALSSGALLMHAYANEVLPKARRSEAIEHLIQSIKARKEVPSVEIAKAHLHQELESSPGLLFRALTLFGWEVESLEAYRAFKARIDRGEGVSSPAVSKAEMEVPENRRETVAAYTQTLTAAVQSGSTIDLSELGIQAHCDLLREMCLHRYDGDVQKLVTALRDHAAAIPEHVSPVVCARVEEVLSKVCPAVLEVFEKLQAFKAPASLKRALFPHQIAAIVENVYQGKRINAHEMGNGKSMTATALCELNKFERVMWVTGASNREGARDEILLNVEIDSARVVCIPREVTKWSGEKLTSFLKDARYVVCSYETLRACYRNNSAVYERLCAWAGVNDALVIDEAHLFDNPASQRSRALAGISARWRYALTGSGYQGKFSNIANLIHLIDPSKYPDVEELRRLCQNREFAQVLLSRYASIAFTEDIAHRFKPPEVASFHDQLLSGLPHVPRAVDQPLIKVEMSLPRATAYFDIACNFERWLEKIQPSNSSRAVHDPKHRAFRQLVWMMRALYDPEKIGEGPAVELLQAAKQIALPAMQRGEKVLFFCQHRALVNLLCSDAELRAHGAVRLDGMVAPEVRAAHRKALEDDGGTRCAVAQFDAAATGSNLRSIDHVIYLESPTLFSTYWQSRGRTVRNLGPGDERFARTEVKYWHIVQSLPHALLQSITNPETREKFESGTLSERWHANLQRQREDFLYLMRRKKEVFENATDSALEYISSLAAAGSRSEYALGSSGIAPLLRAGMHGQEIVDYGTPVKAEYRRLQEGFIVKHLHCLNPECDQVLALLGPELLELPLFDRIGFKRHNVHAVEGGTSLARKIFHENIRETGCRYYITRLEELLPHLDHEFGVVSIDRDGYLTPKDLDVFRSIRIAPYSIVVKNALAAREEYGARELLVEADQSPLYSRRREILESAFFKLIGTAHTHPLGHLSGVESLKLYNNLRYLGREWGVKICEALGSSKEVDQQKLSKFLVDTYLGSATILDEERFKYQSPNGSPLLTRFALLQKADDAQRETPLALFARQLMLHGLQALMHSRERSCSDTYRFKAEKGELRVYRTSELVVKLATHEIFKGQAEEPRLKF